MLKSMGALSLGIAAPSIAKGEVLVEPYKTNITVKGVGPYKYIGERK